MALNVRTEKLRGGCYIPAPGLRGRFSVVRSRRVSGGPGGPYGELRSGHELFASVEQQSRGTSQALSVLASWRPFIVSTIYRAGFYGALAPPVPISRSPTWTQRLVAASAAVE